MLIKYQIYGSKVVPYFNAILASAFICSDRQRQLLILLIISMMIVINTGDSSRSSLNFSISFGWLLCTLSAGGTSCCLLAGDEVSPTRATVASCTGGKVG